MSLANCIIGDKSHELFMMNGILSVYRSVAGTVFLNENVNEF